MQGKKPCDVTAKIPSVENEKSRMELSSKRKTFRYRTREENAKKVKFLYYMPLFSLYLISGLKYNNI